MEAPPETAMHVAHHLTTRAREMTHSKLSAAERRRGLKSFQINGLEQSRNAVNLLNKANGNFLTRRVATAHWDEIRQTPVELLAVGAFYLLTVLV